MEKKICRTCPDPTPQPITNFYVRRDKKCGYSSQCKKCQIKATLKNYYKQSDLLIEEEEEGQFFNVEKFAKYYAV